MRKTVRKEKIILTQKAAGSFSSAAFALFEVEVAGFEANVISGFKDGHIKLGVTAEMTSMVI
ncbi:MAG: hypothetical protein Q4C54_04605 [Clostridia bacterium]|nr:hypothetical protein [Clostridia bacterium]